MSPKTRSCWSVAVLLAIVPLFSTMEIRGQTSVPAPNDSQTAEAVRPSASAEADVNRLSGERSVSPKMLTDQTGSKDNFTVYWKPLLAPLASLIAAIGGWFITFTVLKRGFRHQEEIRRDEQKRQDAQRTNDQRHSDGARIESFLVDSLKYFERGTQKRSIGIGFVEGYFDDFPKLHHVWTPVLQNQAVYIISKIHKDRGVPDHELDNLKRIGGLLKKARLTDFQKQNLREAIETVDRVGLRDRQALALTELAEFCV